MLKVFKEDTGTGWKIYLHSVPVHRLLNMSRATVSAGAPMHAANGSH
jgi:hypothetical protein